MILFDPGAAVLCVRVGYFLRTGLLLFLLALSDYCFSSILLFLFLLFFVELPCLLFTSLL